MRSAYLTGVRLTVQRVVRLPYAIDKPFVEKCAELRVSAASVIERLIAGWLDGTFDIPLDGLRRSRTHCENDPDNK